MIKKYDNYIFDLYGTLVDITTDEEKNILWKQLALFYGFQGARYSASEIKKRYHEIVELKLKDKKAEESARYGHEAYPEIQIEDVFELLYKEKDVEPTKDLIKYTCQMFRISSIEWLKVYPGAIELLTKLRKQGKVYLLSNAQRQFTEYELIFLGIAPLFDGILISSDKGTGKPDASFFNRLKDEYGVDFSKSIMIGNDSENDIAGAKAVGMDTFYLRSNISPEDDPIPDATYILEEIDLLEVANILTM